ECALPKVRRHGPGGAAEESKDTEAANPDDGPDASVGKVSTKSSDEGSSSRGRHRARSEGASHPSGGSGDGGFFGARRRAGGVGPKGRRAPRSRSTSVRGLLGALFVARPQ